MKQAMFNPPFKVQLDANLSYDTEENRQILENICLIFEGGKKEKCSLHITEDCDRTKKCVFNIWNSKAISGKESEPKMSIEKDGIYWRLNGELHRKNGPAIEYNDGGKKWYFLGQLHREGDLPAVELLNGTTEWWKNGKLHRDKDDDNSPTLIDSNGTKEWYKDGHLHRDGDLPATIYKDGRKEWWIHGEPIKQQKLDGKIRMMSHSDSYSDSD